MAIRFGVAGTAHWANSVHVPGLLATPNVELAGIWGRNADKGREIAPTKLRATLVKVAGRVKRFAKNRQNKRFAVNELGPCEAATLRLHLTWQSVLMLQPLRGFKFTELYRFPSGKLPRT